MNSKYNKKTNFRIETCDNFDNVYTIGAVLCEEGPISEE
jgi:hypothetical protein